mmetsp:Transcript_6168/g.9954  ORF Transcript_6168/g.9954 Transcript_6168/m.9954 type:complete len:100 (-) Transcript_6168:793-1092(-)
MFSAIDHKFKIKGLIGEGAYGKVYKAKHLETGLTVAIKAVSVSPNSREEKVIEDEIEMLKMLSQIPGNKFTTKVFEVVRSEFRLEVEYFIVMQYMPMSL